MKRARSLARCLLAAVAAPLLLAGCGEAPASDTVAVTEDGPTRAPAPAAKSRENGTRASRTTAPPAPPAPTTSEPASAASAGPAAAGGTEFPSDWFFQDRRRGGGRYQQLVALEGKPAPTLSLAGWIGEPQSLDQLSGKVVVIDFWGTWCGPCMMALPHNVQLADKYRDQDVVFIGVHDSKKGWDRMGEVAKRVKINYPLAIDVNRQSEQAWKVSFWPTYAVIDRTGIVRAAGLRPDHLEDVIKAVVAGS